MKNNLFKLILSLFAIALFVGSCDEVGTQPIVDTDAAQDNLNSKTAVGNIFEAVEAGIGTAKSLTVCPIVTFVKTSASAGNLSLDYGTGGCPGTDGLIRSGKIYAQISGYQLGWVEDTKAVVTFVDYFVDGHQVTGGITITSHITGDVKSFTIVSSDMALAFSDKTKIQWGSTQTMTLMNIDNYGKYWSVTGSSEGTSRKGISFSDVSTALLSDPRCRWFVGGTLSISAGDNVDVVTFGSTCGSVTVKHNNMPAIPLVLN